MLPAAPHSGCILFVFEATSSRGKWVLLWFRDAVVWGYFSSVLVVLAASCHQQQELCMLGNRSLKCFMTCPKFLNSRIEVKPRLFFWSIAVCPVLGCHLYIDFHSLLILRVTWKIKKSIILSHWKFDPVCWWRVQEA